MKKNLFLVVLIGVMLLSIACTSMEMESKVAFEESAQGSYKIHSKLYVDEDKQIQISYPKIIDYKDDSVEKFVNQSIEDITEIYGTYSKYKNVEISYELIEKEDGKLDIVFTGTAKSDGEKILRINETFSFDLND